MARIILFYMALLAAPFLLFGLWRYLVSGRRLRWRRLLDGFVVFLMLAMGTLLFALLFHLASNERSDPGKHYVPAHVEDGRTIPGHFE